MHKIIVVTGASRGFGRLASNALARAGHTVYASMRDTAGRNAARAAEAGEFARQNGVDLRAIELDVASQASVDAAIAAIISEHSRLDVVLHNAGHTVYGPSEAFTPEQLAQLYDTNVLGTQRVNRAALPQLRKQGLGLVLWMSSSSARGGTPPYLGPYFASKAAMEALAVSYACELARWGIETSIIVPGSFNSYHYAHSGRPADATRAEEYADGPTADISEIALKGLAALAPKESTMSPIASTPNCCGGSALPILSSRRSSAEAPPPARAGITVFGDREPARRAPVARKFPGPGRLCRFRRARIPRSRGRVRFARRESASHTASQNLTNATHQ